MPLQRTARSLACIAVPVIALAVLASCAKDPLRVDRNRAPRTFLVSAPLDSTVAHPTATNVSYSYRVHLYWRGEDPDGYVVGFLWAFDDSSAGHFHYTTKTDSIFDLTVNDSTDITGGSTLIGVTRYHTFYIRAVDNLGKPDPSSAVFNRTTFKAETIKPHVQFVDSPPWLFPGDGMIVNSLPSPSARLGRGYIDTLSDGLPFRVSWTGDDSDGVVIRYKFDVGSYTSPLMSDTFAVFNDVSNPNSVGLASGIYKLTITAVDNALAVGKTDFLFVTNHDPETWFEPKGGPNGYYHAPYVGGELQDEAVVVPFGEGDTVPFRSVVWFNWDGEDIGRPGTPNNPLPESNCINGYSLELRGGSRDGGNPYVIGFIDSIDGSPRLPFKTNEPNYLRQRGFSNLVLDSLDAGFNMFMLAASRDCSNRGDGTKAAFRFNCNYRPFMDSLVVEEGIGPAPFFEPGRLITWFAHDYEDGAVRKAKIKLDATSTRVVTVGGFEQTSYFVPDSTFAHLAPSNPHSVEVWAIDRADFVSDTSMIRYFDLVAPTSRPTRRP